MMPSRHQDSPYLGFNIKTRRHRSAPETGRYNASDLTHQLYNEGPLGRSDRGLLVRHPCSSGATRIYDCLTSHSRGRANDDSAVGNRRRTVTAQAALTILRRRSITMRMNLESASKLFDDGTSANNIILKSALEDVCGYGTRQSSSAV
jgi:hypothetical protein